MYTFKKGIKKTVKIGAIVGALALYAVIVNPELSFAWFDPMTQVLDTILELSNDIGDMSLQIGVMADRILLMADKIGEMADRIVQTEQMMADVANQLSACGCP